MALLKFLQNYNYSFKKKVLLRSLKVIFVVACFYSVFIIASGLYKNSGVIILKALLLASKSVDIEPPQLFGKIGGIGYKSNAGKAYIIRDYQSSGKEALKFEDFVLSIDYPSGLLEISSDNSLVDIQNKILFLNKNVVLSYSDSTKMFLDSVEVDIINNVITSTSNMVLVAKDYKVNSAGFKKEKDKINVKGPFKVLFN